MNNTTKYEKGFVYYDNRGAKNTLLEWTRIKMPFFEEEYRWRIKCEFAGVESLAWTDDGWIDVHTGKAFVNELTHKIVYYDQVDILPKVIEQPIDVFADMRKIGLSSDQCSEVSDYVEKNFRQR